MKLAQDIGCFACHAIEKKLLGPAWKTVAQINRDVPDAKARLMNKISKGGSGVWGRSRCRLIRISRKRKRTLVKFILSLE